MTEQNLPEDYQNKLKLFQAMTKLDSKEKEVRSSQNFSKAYLLSALLPPIGLFFFVKYAILAKNLKAGIIALGLTVVSLLLSFWLVKGLFQQEASFIDPENSQIIEDLTDPEGQKELLELFK